MADDPKPAQSAAPAPETAAAPSAAAALGSATYEIIRQRLQAQGTVLQERVGQLNARRQEVFGSVEFKLLQSDRVTTVHNCIPRDMVQLGRGRFLFGFNVQFGLKQEIKLEDVFAIYHRDEADGAFKESTLDVLQQKQFITDFKRLYQVYDRAVFSKFSLIEGNLYMVFQIGAGANETAKLGLAEIPAARFVLAEGHAAPGYGRPNDGMIAAVRLLAQCEGVVLDPVYTGKAMAGLIEIGRAHV